MRMSLGGQPKPLFMSALDQVTELLQRCGSNEGVMPPTQLYNEGWMLRLTLNWFDRHRDLEHALAFREGSVWYSEALLGSRFFGETRGDSRAEGWTNADGVIGHFRLRPGGRGDIELLPDARQLIVLEAKLGSGLSGGVKNARRFNQAARNVACIAHHLEKARRPPEALESLAFYLVAPESRINQGLFKEFLELDGPNGIRACVAERVRSFAPKHDEWHADYFERTLVRAAICPITWESIISYIRRVDAGDAASLQMFYDRCRQFNRVDLNLVGDLLTVG
jgi:hypothetical protein